MPCVLQNVTDGLGDSLLGMLDGLAENVDNFTSCIQTQLLSGMIVIYSKEWPSFGETNQTFLPILCANK